MSGWKDWAIGEVVTESDFQSFVQDQVVQRYTDATDRDNTLGANVATGMAAYLETEQLFQVYDGSAWVEISGSGTQISDTPPSDPDVGDTWWDSTNGKFYVYFDSYWVQVQLGEAGPQGESGVLAVTSPITYDAGTSTVGIDETAIAIDQDQVTGLANGTSGYTAVSDGSTLTYQPVSHNYIINGAFDVAQRGTSFTNVAFTYTLDRWEAGRGGFDTGLDISRVSATDLDDFRYAMRVQRASGNTSTQNIRNAYILETADSIPLTGKAVTLSFFARKGADWSTTTLDVALISGTGTDEGNIAASDVFASGPATVVTASPLLTTSWQRFTMTGTVATSATQLAIRIRNNNTGTAGASDYYEITGVQLEAGSVATPFKRNAPSLQGELASCQRYYIRFSAETGQAFSAFTGQAYTNSTTVVEGNFPLPVEMRVPPTGYDTGGSIVYRDVTNASGTLTALGLAGSSQNRKLGYFVWSTSGATAGRYIPLIRANNDVTAFIGFTAEL